MALELSRRLVWKTALAPEECLERIKRLGPRQSWWSYVSDEVQTFSKVTGADFEVGALTPGYRNSFLKYLEGRVSALEFGSRIDGELKLYPFTVIFMIIWFIGVLGLGGSAFLVGLFKVVDHGIHVVPTVLPHLLVGPGMMLAGIGLVYFGARLSRPEEQAILKFFEEELGVTQIDVDGGDT